MARERRRRRLAHLARWLEIFWWCGCNYCNVATYRCYYCGARPPRDLRAAVAAKPLPGDAVAAKPLPGDAPLTADI